MRYQGRITNWNDDKGFGFVTPNGGGKKAFVHIKAFLNSRRRPTESDLITYELTTDQQHRLRAGSIKFAGDPSSSSAPSGNKSVGIIFATLFCCFVLTISVIGKLSFVVPILYALASTTTFMVYAFDKAAAFQNRWRTSENTLHLLSLVGGWPGALVAQRMFHHKSKKAAFQSDFWITVFLNCSVLTWLLTEAGASFLYEITGLP